MGRIDLFKDSLKLEATLVDVCGHVYMDAHLPTCMSAPWHMLSVSVSKYSMVLTLYEENHLFINVFLL